MTEVRQDRRIFNLKSFIESFRLKYLPFLVLSTIAETFTSVAGESSTLEIICTIMFRLYLVFRNIVYLIAEYLKEAGLHKSNTTVIDEAQLSTEFTVCDNVDLETIYLEFCSYFLVKFGKKPRFVKKIDSKAPPVVDSRQTLAKKRSSLKSAAPLVSTIFPELPVKDFEPGQCLHVSSLSPPTHDDANGKVSPIFKPMSNEDFVNDHPTDWKEMAEIIFKDVIRRDLCVKWSDVVGLDDAKMILQESVIHPMKYPQLFDRIQPWRGR